MYGANMIDIILLIINNLGDGLDYIAGVFMTCMLTLLFIAIFTMLTPIGWILLIFIFGDGNGM